MRFNVIHEFNLDFLAKKLQKLLQFLDAPLTRVLRGKHFKFISPLRAKLSDNHFYAWTSFVASKAFQSFGIRKIFTLVMRKKDERIHGFQRSQLESLVVQDYITLTKSLLVNHDRKHDGYCQMYTRHGFYTMRSWYWVARNVMVEAVLDICTEPSLHAFQSYVWKIKALHNMCHLI